jgi:putative transposase
MPRGPRLDAPGIVHHVWARGIERRKVFRTDRDREDFLRRLDIVTRGDRAFVYGWTLIPNHFHLAIRSGTEKLASVMSRLMTGYATAFNCRYKRQGHLFQNRYKSTVVDDDAYLLSLVRYIHLNPLRAGLVRSVAALTRYPWSGHAALMGFAEHAFQDIDEILGRFGRQAGNARKRLVSFMSDRETAKSEEHLFKGGGLVRSAGGLDQLKQMPKGERQMYDERILGDGQFVEAILKKAERSDQLLTRSKTEKAEQFAKLQDKVCKRLKVSPASLGTGSRARQIVRARVIIAYMAGRYLGWTGRKIAVNLGVSPASVSRSIARGEKETSELGWDVDTLIR